MSAKFHCANSELLKRYTLKNTESTDVGKKTDVYDTRHVLYFFNVCITAFHIALRMSPGILPFWERVPYLSIWEK